jgi:hypothetical protein
MSTRCECCGTSAVTWRPPQSQTNPRPRRYASVASRPPTIPTQNWCNESAKPPDAERPPDAAGAHARRKELPAGPVDAGLATNDRHPGQECHDAENGIGQREKRNHGDEHGAGGVMQCQCALNEPWVGGTWGGETRSRPLPEAALNRLPVPQNRPSGRCRCAPRRNTLGK